ncbi:PEP-CTERM sorting domain-containing protein [Candidatus Contendibacter odensensis]|uniref:Ice-binding protein C-terminal domain-containing protein n=1 Tax=Candidatus Contendobacter odensis Run_B_J11 TaxID=1400861 RepID=A0A7U7J665_9GAMM|nr:PEP-CTERM sorting domain-containing protein [Candidatus Contendobacter odensis]CDH47455.1 conserved exported hypothetical protein [Candidatus Contendobacter odensis Run_B_J11]
MNHKSLVFIAALGFAGAADATLINRGGGLIYDDVLNITWLQDANYAKTQYDNSGGALGDADGLMNWDTANTWAANLSYYDSVRGVTYNDWRLPTVKPINGVSFIPVVAGNATDGTRDLGYNLSAPGTLYAGSTGSELAYMHYQNLGNIGAYDTGGTATECLNIASSLGCLDNTGPFVNLMDTPGTAYWSGTEFEPDTTQAFFFETYYGEQGINYKNALYYAWAVRDGNVTTPSSSVPEPGSLVLVGLGLMGLGWVRRRA